MPKPDDANDIRANDLRSDEVRSGAAHHPKRVYNAENEAKARDRRERRPEGVAVPPVLPGQPLELNEAEKTLARQQAAAGETGDRTPEQAAQDKAKEMAMTDQPNLAELEAVKAGAQTSARNA